jgi:molybdopterin-guanine dinucleotide biosynthesis protein MobB
MKRKAVAIAVVGSKRSGKTTTVEALVRELAEKGYRIAAVKHISEHAFTIDTKGKDTWRYAQAGAQMVIGICAGEVATIEKADRTFSLEDLLERSRGHDVVFLEGFKKLVTKVRSIPKIVVVKSKDEALEAASVYEPIIAFAGPYSTESLNLKAPYVDALNNPAKLARIVEAFMARGQQKGSRA